MNKKVMLYEAVLFPSYEEIKAQALKACEDARSKGDIPYAFFVGNLIASFALLAAQNDATESYARRALESKSSFIK